MNTIPFYVTVPESERETFYQDFVTGFYLKQRGIAEATIGKKAVELTPEELFAVAVVGGAKITESWMEGCNMMMKTEPCVIRDNEGGGFTVVRRMT